MALRDVTFEKFGPLLLEAICESLLEEINALRIANGLPAETFASFMGTLNNSLNHLTPYGWMENQ